MIEELKKQREEYAAEVEVIEAQDISVLIEEELLKVKEEISKRVMEEHNKNLADAKLKVEHYDFVISHLGELESEKIQTSSVLPNESEVIANAD